MEENIAKPAEDNQEEAEVKGKDASGNDEKSAGSENIAKTAEVKGKDASGKPAGEDDDNALFSPQEKRAHRKIAPNSSINAPPKFEVATQLTANKRAEVYYYIQKH
jgi:hypothetical protein